MAANKPSIPKGTRDFGPKEMAERNYIFDTIRSVFRTFGYSQIETPAMENLSTLLGKYGDEGDKLLFRILNSGDPFGALKAGDYLGEDGVSLQGAALTREVCEKGLRYDLTVPFARYVVQHQSELTFPFRRFQIQPVWRADRPQKGRYREFYQCDADVIGSRSQINELELVQIVDKVFSRLGIRVLVKINNRKVLGGLAEITGHPDKVVDITVAIDKLDKIGLDAVKDEIRSRGLDEEGVKVIEQILSLQGSTREKISAMRILMNGGAARGIVSETGLKGLDELEELFSFIDAAAPSNPVEMDLSLARGLNYYTGAIFEVKAVDFQIGSICGGGRYDNLTGIFGLPDMSGVGISFGADRIYDVMKGLDKFPEDSSLSTRVLFFNMDRAAVAYLMPVISKLRDRGIGCELYPDTAKIRKQFDYATRKNIPFISINGESEVLSRKVNLKNPDGIQESFLCDDIEGMVSFLTK